MSASSTALSVADLPSVVDEEFLTKVAEILERLRMQSEARGHPLLSALLAIAKDEAEDDLRTRACDAENSVSLGETDEGVVLMAQRLACGRRDEASEDKRVAAELLSFIRG